MIVINLFGEPGAGKSTGAAYIFSQLKMLGINAELVTECAKDKVWEGNTTALKNQAYIFGEQFLRMSRCENKVDVIVTDSPLPLNIIYNKDNRLTENFNKTVMDVFNSYNNVNLLVVREKPYNETGRQENEQEAKNLKSNIEKMLQDKNIAYTSIPSNIHGYYSVVKAIIENQSKKGEI